ncbi:MAG: hypothetical protein JW893_03430 [Candidatus Omnitrophica bacterium]|nr:hypothetical protein [Candidatus Omnitrophota bacterium]
MKKRKNNRIGIVFVLTVLAIVCLFVFYAHHVIKTKYPWLPDYVIQQLSKEKFEVDQGPRHLMFLMVDHFEPHDQAAMDRWMEDYPKMAVKHRDADGRYPQHTWYWMFFYADEEESFHYLQQLSQLAYDGFGEIEKHLHHRNDTEAGFLEKMGDGISLSQKTGAMITAETRPRTAFSFIHGLWALDNSRGGNVCGVNNEIILLKRLGCYADFTHPSWGRMHPSIVNKIYYAIDDPEKPKSYDRGIEMQVGRVGVGDLVIFTGQSFLTFEGLKPRYDHGEIDPEHLPTPERIDRWVQHGIHVKGRPEWIFVKVFSHGAEPEDHDVMLGEWRNKLHAYLEEKYNDGKRYVLHYVTGREAYNIAKAAEAGKTGNPTDYRDFVIPPYVNRSFIASSAFETMSFDPNGIVVKFLMEKDAVEEARIHYRVTSVQGACEVQDRIEKESETIIKFKAAQDKPVCGFNIGEKPKAAETLLQGSME